MHSRSVFLALAALIALAPALHAQGSLIQIGPSRDAAPTAGDTQNINSPFPDALYIAPIPNAPFTASIIGDRTSTQSMTRNSQFGQTVFTGNHRIIARDAAGHIMMEQRAFIHNGQKEDSDLLATDFLDAKSGKFVRCIVQTKTCTIYSLRTTEAGYLTYTAADHAVLGITPEQLLAVRGAKFKNLNQKTLEGISVTGYRAHMETDLNGGDSGNAPSRTPTTAINYQTFDQEVWYASDLQIDLKMTYSNSLGEHTDTLKDLKRGDPDPKLFQVPGGYKIVNAAAGQ